MNRQCYFILPVWAPHFIQLNFISKVNQQVCFTEIYNKSMPNSEPYYYSKRWAYHSNSLQNWEAVAIKYFLAQILLALHSPLNLYTVDPLFFLSTVGQPCSILYNSSCIPNMLKKQLWRIDIKLQFKLYFSVCKAEALQLVYSSFLHFRNINKHLD